MVKASLATLACSSKHFRQCLEDVWPLQMAQKAVLCDCVLSTLMIEEQKAASVALSHVLWLIFLSECCKLSFDSYLSLLSPLVAVRQLASFC